MKHYAGQGEKRMRAKRDFMAARTVFCLSVGWLTLASLILTPAAMAADDLARGCAQYNGGKYNDALPLLQNAVKQKPRNWAGHYYLAHTYLALSQHSLAINEYQACLACHPSAQVQAACQRVIYDLRQQTGLRAHPASAASPAPSQASSQDDSERQQRIQAEKNRILQRANDDASKIRAETARTTTDLTNNSNVRFINRADMPPVDPDVARQLMEKQDARIKAVYDQAHREIDALR